MTNCFLRAFKKQAANSILRSTLDAKLIRQLTNWQNRDRQERPAAHAKTQSKVLQALAPVREIKEHSSRACLYRTFVFRRKHIVTNS